MATQDEVVRRSAYQLLDALRSIGLSRGFTLGFAVTYSAWSCLGDSSTSTELRATSALELLRRTSLGPLIDRDGGARTMSEQGLSRVVDVIADVYDHAGREGLVTLSETLLELDETQQRGGLSEHSSSTWLADLLQALVGAGEVTLDPVCGVGTTLLRITAPAGQAFGYDLNEQAVLIANARFEMAGRRSQLSCQDSIATADELPRGFQSATAVPPWGLFLTPDHRQALEKAGVPAEYLSGRTGRSGLYWTHLLSERLAPGGRAAVVLLDSAALPNPALDILVEEKRLEAVIALPAGFASTTSLAGAVWVVCPPNEAADDVLFLEVSQLSGPLPAPSATAELRAVLERFRAGEDLGVAGHVARAVPRGSFVASEGLSPQRFLDQPPEPVVELPETSDQLLAEVTIGGYKSFGESVRAPLRPITLVYGPNSSGKSTLIQSLLLLKQSLDSPTLISQGDVVNVGSFTGVRHRHTAPEVRFGLAFGAPVWDLPTTGTFDPLQPRRMEFSFSGTGSGQGLLTRARIAAGELDTDWDLDEDGTGMRVPIEQLATTFETLASPTSTYPATRRTGAASDDDNKQAQRRTNAGRLARRLTKFQVDAVAFPWNGLLPSSSAPAAPEAWRSSSQTNAQLETYLRNTARLFAGIGAELQTILSDLVYLGPLRSAPQRFYSRSDQRGLPGDGRESLLALYDNASALETVNSWLRRLEIPYEISVLPVIAPGTDGLVGDLVAIALKDLRSGVTVSPADVGYGISQSMPLVVELATRSNSIICIEQPETHLHPRLQAQLGDLVLDSAKAEGHANQVIIETHSEHLLLRLQRRIREGDLDASQVCVLYVDQDEAGNARVNELRLDGDGDFIDEWPEGFFDERLDELFGGLA